MHRDRPDRRRPSAPPLGRRAAAALLALVSALAVATAAPARAGAAVAPTERAERAEQAQQSERAVGDDVIAWVEVESGTISGGPAYNSGDHGNFSGEGSYTFRETGMTSSMTVTAPAAGTYPVWIRYAAGPLSAAENVTRSMGLVANGVRSQVSYPMTSLEDWETWRFVRQDVVLAQGTNTVAISCDRGVDFCRLNFDAIQVGGTAPDPCAATPPEAGWTALFDGTFTSFDRWRKAASGGFGRQTDCTIRSVRGRGATWYTTQLGRTYTLRLDWRRGDADDDSAVHLGSSSRGGADPAGGFSVLIGGTGGAETGGVRPAGGAVQAPDAGAVAGALRPVGSWNTFTLRLTSRRLQVLLNGTLVNTVDRTAPAPGFVGLENRGASDRVDFRGIAAQDGVTLGQVAGPVRRARAAEGTGVDAGAESTFANFLADVERWATRNAPNGAAQLALVHPDALAADLAGAGTPGAGGAVTDEQADVALPSTDQLVTLSLSGAEIASVLEEQWQRNADGTTPARPFVRLGASSGFRYTFDPSAAAGSRITGAWLDGVALVPTRDYRVTVSSTLANGGGNFRTFLVGGTRRTTATTAYAAVSDYLADRGAAGPVAADPTQRAVGVELPAGAPTSYAAGDPVVVDLSSWSFTSADEPRDATVTATLGGRPLGSFPVDSTVGAATAGDLQGRVAVRGVVPAGTPAGVRVLRVVGDTTGTVAEVPLTVARSTSATTLTLDPGPVTVGGTATASVTVTAPGGAPTGDVELWSGATRLATVTLTDGTGATELGPFDSVGTVAVEARYLGDAATEPSTSAASSVEVVRAATSTTLTASPTSVTVAGGTTRVGVAVTGPDGVVPTGDVEIWAGSTRLTTVPLVDGRAAATVGPFPRVGPQALTARYLGSASAAPSSSAATTVTVAKARPRVTAVVQPRRVVAGRTRPTVTVRVTAPGFVPTGQAAVRVGNRTYVAAVRGGKAAVTLPRLTKPGRVTAMITYRGDARTAPATTRATFTVVRAPRRGR